MLSRKKFYTFLAHYKPLFWEEFSKTDPRYDLKKRSVNYALVNRERFYFVLYYALKHLKTEASKVVDLGTYPGTMLRILREFLVEYRFDLFGVGLRLEEEFVRRLTDLTSAKLMAVNLDPKNDQLREKNYPTRIPLGDQSIDCVFALDIVEHLTSPIHILDETKRILRKDGTFIISTPNVTRIGSVFKLLIGRSNYDCLAPIGYYNENDEWRPHFREYSMSELTGLLSDAGFAIADKVFFNSNETHFNVKDAKQRIVDLLKIPFCCIPHFREHTLIVAKKL